MKPVQRKAFIFIVFFGFVSLLADITYEGARSISGAYLGMLGANAAAVGVIAGFGEFAGYGLRYFSGYLADRTKRYWTITLIGYTINLFAVPLLALAHHWQTAAVLIICERIGKAIRVPSRDAMLSYASQSIGTGFGFGLHEALDKLGAMTGPVLIAMVLYLEGSYQSGFAILAIPALLALCVLLLLRFHYPQPAELEIDYPEIEMQPYNRLFWIYVIGACFVGAGFADFALIAYHFQKTQLLSLTWIPLSYAIAMGINSILSPILGHLYDRKGFIILIIITLIAAGFAPCVFLGSFKISLLGVALWSIGISTQQSLMRAIIGKMTAKSKRASAYGMFNMCYGLSWFLGSSIMGFIYDQSTIALVIFIMSLQVCALPWLFFVYANLKTTPHRISASKPH